MALAAVHAAMGVVMLRDIFFFPQFAAHVEGAALNRTRSRILPCLLIGLIAVFLLQVRPFEPATPFRLEVAIFSDTAGRARLMWRSEKHTVAPDSDAALVSKGRQVLSFNLPDTGPGTFRLDPHAQDAIDLLRFNPLDRAGRVVIGEAFLIGPQDEIIARFPPSAFLPTRRDLGMKVEGGAATFAVQPGDGVLLQPGKPVQLARLSMPFEVRSSALQFCGAALAMWLVLVLAGRTPDAVRARLARALAKMRDDLATWPAATLFVAALAATAMSCHPVIFFGRSFVSPDNGPVQLLYNNFPELVQPPHEVMESSRGADNGATMWAHLPYSVMQHRAIFGDGELPLWNRYTYCGGPLLAQGQSMLGDPLHWIPIAAGGASWAWDVKFCIAKLLFSFGVGLLAFAATRRVWLAALLAFSSSFIGFFAFRFNHCAFFSLCYAPWILHCWLRAARTAGRVWPWAIAIALANFWELSSGTAKESAMLIACLNLTGGLLVLFAGGTWRSRLTRLALMAFGNVLFVMLSAPHWMVFLDALRQAWTSYAAPEVWQLQPGLALGLFDDLFFGQTTKREMLVNPSLNFLVLLGCLWAAVDLRRLLRDRTFAAVLLGAVLPAAMVFGIVPPTFIARLPFIGNIGHVANTFSCVLIIHLLVIAAFGLRSLWDRARKPCAPGDAVIVAMLLALLVALFFGGVHAAHTAIATSVHAGAVGKLGGFFCAYAPALVVALLAMPWVVRGLRLRPGAGHVVLGVLCLTVFHFRHGQWTETKFDAYVANPKARTDLAALTPALATVRATIEHSGEPARVAGLDEVLAPGFNTVLGFEHFAGADALVSRWQRELMEKSGMPLVWDWRCVLPRAGFPRAQIFGDLWNIRWYLGTPAEMPHDVRGLKLMTALDLEIYASPTVWPRAFFTDRLAECSSVDDFVALLGASDGHPFAALVPEKDSGAPAAKPESLTGRAVVPAGDYHLTENSTTFTIRAPTPGVAVLGDSFESGNWRVTLDGRRTGCFRVNHAFLGVAIPEAGVHTLRFEYWPRVLTPALWISLAGAVALLGAIAIFSRRAPAPVA